MVIPVVSRYPQCHAPVADVIVVHILHCDPRSHVTPVVQMLQDKSNIGGCLALRKPAWLDSWRLNSLPGFPPRPHLASNPAEGEALLPPGAAGGRLTWLGHVPALKRELSTGQQTGRQRKLLKWKP